MKRNKITALTLAVIIAMLLFLNFLLGEKTKGEWEITQYGNPEENQRMFYTITDRKGHLVVIDGGWTENAEEVRSVITAKGGHVDAWILTHPHQDHIAAFMDIYDKPGRIKIDRIYAVDMPAVELCRENASWDEFGTYERFLQMEIPQLDYVHSGDEWKIGNLKFEVLSAYEDQVDQMSNDLLNDGSMMFRVTGESESMLFCADVGKSMSDYLVKEYGEELKSDYLQMGHHGNGGLKRDFYELVSPKIAFFDAPNWLFYDEAGHYTTPKNRKIMEKLGSEIKNYESAPNRIILK
ncbi:MAG: MBL fold metallo-hydrolase [Lachnospiraceae bacterium]|nr:MBL fold metallo-hydrolase [Lachnospiraceae bacterium]